MSSARLAANAHDNIACATAIRVRGATSDPGGRRARFEDVIRTPRAARSARYSRNTV